MPLLNQIRKRLKTRLGNNFRDYYQARREILKQLPFTETAAKIGKNLVFVAVVLSVAWLLKIFYSTTQITTSTDNYAAAANLVTSTPTIPSPDLSPLEISQDSLGLTRKAELHTDVPSRGREGVITYTVKVGDTLFGISDKFGIKPETLLWGNQYVLGDNPHNLRPGQEINILPVDGTYHRWSEGDGLNGVANFFSVNPEDIINFPGNQLDPTTIGDWSNPNIDAGTWLVIPEGRRAFVSWSAPIIPRDDPSVAVVLGAGACDSVVSGIIGSGVFIWPANNHFLSGYDYVPEANHPGIDIDGEEGDPVYASDSGVIVYAGWNDWGYGNVIVVNHGNGWQTLYAHLHDYYVTCGQSVWQGNVIGTIGNTGNSTGSHLHFELMINGERVNPHNYLQ
jgi:murein DD-endopeptidase MepM/ murein hydrolase activator NlpD